MIDILFGYIVIFLLLLIITVYCFKRNKKLIFPLWDSIFAAGAVAFILKLIIAKPRMLIPRFYLFGIPSYSFPSMHTTLVFAAFPVLVKTKLKWYWLGYAILVGVSRIILKQHDIIDVIGGVVVGLGIGYLIVYLYKKYAKAWKKRFKIFRDYL